jgi:hypothetical protein
MNAAIHKNHSRTAANMTTPTIAVYTICQDGQRSALFLSPRAGGSTCLVDWPFGQYAIVGHVGRHCWRLLAVLEVPSTKWVLGG